VEEGSENTETVYLGTQEALAAHLGVDRKSIQRWQKRPDCPGRAESGFHVENWKAFIERNKLGRRPNKSKADLDAEKLALQNERLRLVNAKIRGEMCSVDEVASVLGDLMLGLNAGLSKVEYTMAEETVGVDIPEALKRIKRRHHEVKETLSLGQWAQKKTFWSKVSAALSSLLETSDLGLGQKSM
jgi:hypothetical protein